MLEPLYGQQHYASKPTKMTLFFRTFLPWQLFRLLAVNLRMTIMILKSHDQIIGPPALPPARRLERERVAVPRGLERGAALQLTASP